MCKGSTYLQWGLIPRPERLRMVSSSAIRYNMKWDCVNCDIWGVSTPLRNISPHIFCRIGVLSVRPRDHASSGKLYPSRVTSIHTSLLFMLLHSLIYPRLAVVEERDFIYPFHEDVRFAFAVRASMKAKYIFYPAHGPINPCIRAINLKINSAILCTSGTPPIT